MMRMHEVVLPLLGPGLQDLAFLVFYHYLASRISPALREHLHLFISKLGHLIKMKQLFIDSRDRTATSASATDFVVEFPSTLNLDLGQRLRIDNLRIPLCIPTIRTGENSQLTVSIGVGNYTIEIPQGQYDGVGLAARIQGLLQNTCPGSWTVDYDTANISMTISSTNPFTLGGSYGIQLMSHPYTRTSAQYHFTYVSMLGVDIMYLCCSQLVNMDKIFGPRGSHDTVMCAVVTCSFGSVLDVSMPYDCWIDAPAMTTQNMSFQLRDRNYKVLSIVPTISFVMTID